MSRPRRHTVPCVGPSCADHIIPGLHFCSRCRKRLLAHGHEAALETLDDAQERGLEDQVGHVRGQLIGALAAIGRPRRRRG